MIVTQNGCSDTSACETISTVGIEQMTAADVMTVYPNPSKGVFALFDHQSALSGELVTVTNVLGETVYSTNITGNKTEINLTSAQDGIYFVSIDSDFGKLVTKIIKE